MVTAKANLQKIPLPSLGRSAIRSVEAQVLLGTPSAGCHGVGICRVLACGMRQNFKCPAVSAFISVTADGRLRMKFLKAGMERGFIKQHFGRQIFEIVEPYRVPDTLIQKFGLKGGQCSIEPGIYTVMETLEYLIVDF